MIIRIRSTVSGSKRFALAARFGAAGDRGGRFEMPSQEGLRSQPDASVLTSTLKVIPAFGCVSRIKAELAGEDREVHVKDRDFHPPPAVR